MAAQTATADTPDLEQISKRLDLNVEVIKAADPDQSWLAKTFNAVCHTTRDSLLTFGLAAAFATFTVLSRGMSSEAALDAGPASALAAFVTSLCAIGILSRDTRMKNDITAMANTNLETEKFRAYNDRNTPPAPTAPA